MKARRILITILCVALSQGGCQTMRPVDLSAKEPLIARVGPSDHVRVWMRDGRTLDLQLTAVEPDALVSGDQRLPVTDIERVERREFSWSRTTLLVVGIGVVTFIAAAATAAHSVGFNWH